MILQRAPLQKQKVPVHSPTHSDTGGTMPNADPTVPPHQAPKAK